MTEVKDTRITYPGESPGQEAGHGMDATSDKEPDNGKEHAGNSPADIPRSAIYSYYRDGMGNVGGLKIKWSVRVVSGPEAARVDARQAEAIREILRWAHQHNRLPPAT